MGESQFLQYAVNARHGDVVGKLPEEDSRDESHTHGIVEDGLEVVLLDINGSGRAHLETIAAVDAAVGNEHGFAVA